MSKDYSAVTEVPGFGITEEALRMLQTRYGLMAEQAADKDLLEIAAGAGLGLGWAAGKARRVVGTDITPSLVRAARETYGARIDLGVADGSRLPFADASFDVVAVYEAIYYIPDVRAFLAEVARVLRPGGTLILCTANKHRPGFVRSPYSVAYYDPSELTALFRDAGLVAPRFWGAFSAKPPSLFGRLTLVGFGIADRLRLIPRTLEGRARVKRLLHGKLDPAPRALSPDTCVPEPLRAWTPDAARAWKVIYASATKGGPA